MRLVPNGALRCSFVTSMLVVSQLAMGCAQSQRAAAPGGPRGRERVLAWARSATAREGKRGQRCPSHQGSSSSMGG